MAVDTDIKQLEVLASSQYFGFGPTSNLFVILESIQSLENIKLSLLYNDAIEAFLNNNKLPNTQIVYKKEFQNIDFTISVFDPLLIFYSWLDDIKCFYICNLFWFWEPLNEYDFTNIIEDFSELKILGKYELAKIKFKKLLNDDPHAAILLAFAFATHSFIRKTPNMNVKLKYLGIEQYVKYTPSKIILPKLRQKSVNKKDVIYFQLSGSHTPLSTEEDHTGYLLLINNAIEKLGDLFKDYKFIVCVNPYLLRERSSWLASRKNIEIKPSISLNEHFDILSRSIAIFTSPGLETIFEAIYSQVPIFLLPEQSAGQYRNLYFLQNFGFEPERFVIDEEFPNRKKLQGEHDIKCLYKVIKEIANDNDAINIFSERCCTFLSNILEINHNIDYIHMQDSAIRKYMGEHPFSNGNSIAEKILSIVEG